MDRKLFMMALTSDIYTEIKVPEQMLDVIFENKSQPLGNENGQEKCEDIVFPFSRSNLKNVTINNSKVLLESKYDFEYSKEVREITLDCKDLKEFNWQPGDTIAVLPNNSSKYVDQLLKLLELSDKADRICSVEISKLCKKKNVRVPSYIPSQTTPREIVRDCLNLNTILKKSFLRCLAEYCSDSDEQKFFKFISSKEGSKSYNDLIAAGFNIIKVLDMCSTCKPPFGLIIEHLSRLLPRPYSIANSPLKTKDEITIIFSTLKYGVTTKMLKEKSSLESSSLLIYLREPNYFRYTEDNYQQNQIIIAVGTGLAPFLGFLQHKDHLMNKSKENPGITWLFVGATTKEAVIHRDEILQWQSNNILNNFVESYSRNPNAPFRYVQNALEYNAQRLVELLIKPETYLYVCADGGQISKSIEKCLENILVQQLGISVAESVKMLKDFKAEKKYREDIWL